jgi:hypothetical protein
MPVRLPIEVRVSDNGPGIDPAMRDHIFEPFVSSKKSGQGLGLALVRKLVRDMNGRITHDRDEIGGWTHFRLHLPVAMEGGEKTARQAYKGQTVDDERPAGRRRRIHRHRDHRRAGGGGLCRRAATASPGATACWPSAALPRWSPM